MKFPPMNNLRRALGWPEFVDADNSGKDVHGPPYGEIDISRSGDTDVRLLNQDTGEVRFGDKFPEPDFTAHESQRNKRSLKADGQAGIIARYLLAGGSLTQQEAVRLLAQHNHITNNPHERMREAKVWLERRGITIAREWEGEGKKRRKRWKAVAGTSAAVASARAALGGGK